MEQLNRLELRGRIGNLRISAVGDNKSVAHFSVATNFIYRQQDNSTFEETTWHTCTLWSNRKFPDLNFLKVGAPIYLVGRLRSTRYTAADGTERYGMEVWVNDVQMLPENEPLKSESGL